ncbi:GLUG motif-containing protein [Sedimentisphaera salicampi]|uniref:GLUG domain-containing protein n=1 Tax=Sedimentisphaera salicampi TaxID=1941349 RepID=A0A1W6LKC8_9BACT|nr:GLUG motif-containing protein [Sedimentisphaera salicampi]ARN56227.1 hypothetical protein STSP1_00603 [Sedimentisphaera salicampi]
MCYLRLSILASLIIPAFVFGFAGGDGTESSPYQISTPDHLEAVNSDLSANYILINDIDLTGRTYQRAVIAPDLDYSNIYFSDSPFSGSFCGAGYKILNLNVDAAGVTGNYPSFLGLFGKIDGGEVLDLGMENADIDGGEDSSHIGLICGVNFESEIKGSYASGYISGQEYLGGLCGTNDSGTIENCYAAVEVSGSNWRLGGLCGYNDSGIIANSHAEGSVSGDSDLMHVGGLCGMNSGTIEHCYAAVSVSCGANSSYVGGLCGHHWKGTIENCWASGSVLAEEYLGGLCGYNESGTIRKCFAAGSVSGDQNVGGLCGFTQSIVENCYAAGSVSGEQNVGGLCGFFKEICLTNCYSTGSVSGDWEVGGLCGDDYQGTTSSCFWDTESSGMDSSAGGAGLTTAQMQTLSTFTDAGWDYVNEDNNGKMDLWYQHAGEYPNFYWEYLPGDCNYDGYVGQNDILIMAEQWLQAQPAQTRLEADSNFDDYVDILDYAILTENWFTAE